MSKRDYIIAAAGLLVLILAVTFVISRQTGNSANRSTAPSTATIPKTGQADLLHRASPNPITRSEMLSSLHPKGENAADIYKNAFVLYNMLTDEEKKMLSHPGQEDDAEKANALFDKIAPIMELLRRAGNAAYCDWGLGSPSFKTPLPQMSAVMKLGQLARWSGEHQFLASNPEGALADLATQSALGRGVAGQSLIGFLIESGLDQGVVDIVRRNAGTLSPEATTQALKMFSQERPTDDLARAMSAEAEMTASMVDQLANPKTRDEVLRTIKGRDESENVAGNSEAETSAILAQIQWVAQVDREFASKAALSDAEFNAWWARINQEASSQPFAAEILPVWSSMRNRYQAALVNNSMMAAGLLILQNGPAQLASQIDPTTGQPFTYVQTDTGFELQSTFQTKGKPVKMSFAYPKK